MTRALWWTGAVHALCSTLICLHLAAPAAAQTAPPEVIESITVARAWRESRAAPSDFCAPARIGFTARIEDRFTWRAIDTGADGVVTNANAAVIGEFRACFGPRADGSGIDMYLEGDLDGTVFRGNGGCNTDAVDRPEPGLSLSRCYVEFRDLPPGYIGGYLTSNAVNSRNVTGGLSDPPGYAQASIATIRWWRQR